MLSLVAVVVVIVIGTVAQLNTILCEGTEPPSPSPQIHPPSPQVSLNQRKFRAFILCLAWWWMVSGSAFSSLPACLGWMGLRKIRVHDEEGIQQISPLLRFSDFVQFESACVPRILLLPASSVSQYLVTWIPINADWQLKMQEIRVGHYSANHHHPRCHLLTFVF